MTPDDTTLARLVDTMADAVIVADAEGNWDGYRTVMASGHTRYVTDLLRVPALHADGQRRSIAFTVSLLKDLDGGVTGIAAAVRDETQRWADEQQHLRRQVRERENQ